MHSKTGALFLRFSSNQQKKIAYICSAQSETQSVQFRNCPEQSGNSHFFTRSRNAYIAQCNSRIAPAQSGNRDKVRTRVIAVISK